MFPWFNRSTKKDRPIDVFRNIKKPDLEEAYIKFPRKSLKIISKKRGSRFVESKRPLVEKLQKKYGGKYTRIHTHPEGGFVPSIPDLVNFIYEENQKTGIIVALDKDDNYSPFGYFIMRKNKDFDSSKIKEKEFCDSMNIFHKNYLSNNNSAAASSFKKIARKYNFDYRFIPAKKVFLTEKAQGFKSSRKSLEAKLLIATIIVLSSYIILFLPNITGNAILGLPVEMMNTFTSNLYILGLFPMALLFLIGRYLYSNQ